MIPKVAHFYWGQSKLPYFRYLTLRSFIRCNPDWSVHLYSPAHQSSAVTWKTDEHKHIVKDRCCLNAEDLPVKRISVDFDSIGFSNEAPEIHKADFLRLYLLGTYGGLWSDMDILYFKPMIDCSGFDTAFCISDYGHSVGFLMACENNPFFQYFTKRAIELYDPSEYQTIGSRLLNMDLPTPRSICEKYPKLNHFNIPMCVVYPYDALNISEIFSPGDLSKITDHSIGLHWYAGHPMAGGFQNGCIENCRLSDLLKREGYNA